ncbi:MAG: amino acid-binding ACT [Nitrospina sp.]|nr:amino acid-binding ACT [Nitrospina sp.]
MNQWYLLSMVGEDRPGIVARLSAELCQNGCNLGASSMAKLGDYFTIMVMVEFPGAEADFSEMVGKVSGPLELRSHIDPVQRGHEHSVQPDVRISLYADDRPGVVGDITTSLAEAGLNILHLDSNIGEGEKPTYYVHIEGTVSKGLDALYTALDHLSNNLNMTAQLIPINPEIR